MSLDCFCHFDELSRWIHIFQRWYCKSHIKCDVFHTVSPLVPSSLCVSNHLAGLESQFFLEKPSHLLFSFVFYPAYQKTTFLQYFITVVCKNSFATAAKIFTAPQAVEDWFWLKHHSATAAAWAPLPPVLTRH